MTTEAKHHASAGLPIAVALAATAGFVDAFIYVGVTPVFVANMSGNLVRLGIAGGNSDEHGVFAALVALGAFITGVVLATSHLDSHVRVGRHPRPARALVLEAVLLASLAIIIRSADIEFSASIEPIDFVVVALGATAMGIQAVALRRVGQIAVSTTYGTGAVVRLGEKLALAARRADRPGHVRRRVTIAVLGAVLVSYVAGAGLAAALDGPPELLLVAAAVPFVAALIQRRVPTGWIATTEIL
jgi:uncharacterized membrane protein YoaK (UPF0700 family)